MDNCKTYTPVTKNDFAPKVEAERQLRIASEGATLYLTPDNPKAGAVAFLCIEEVFAGKVDGISLDFEATKALFEALGVLLDERACK